MAYRDELEAAQQQAANLREQVDELEEQLQSDSRVAELEEQMELLEADLIAAAAPPRRRVIELTSWGPAAPIAALWGLALFFAVTQPNEAGAWEIMNVSVAIGVVGTAWSWGRAESLWLLVGATVLKLIVLGSWTTGWWAWSASAVKTVESSLGLFDADFYFFWGAPPFVFAVALVEGWLIRRRLAAGRTWAPPAARSS